MPHNMQHKCLAKKKRKRILILILLLILILMMLLIAIVSTYTLRVHQIGILRMIILMWM